MDLLIISSFIYFLIFGLHSIGNFFHLYFYETGEAKKLITGYSILGILFNTLYFGLNIESKFILLILLIIMIFTICFSLVKKNFLYIIEIKNILIITIIPFIFFVFIGQVYGEQYYVFRGNYWDYFNYISTALIFAENDYSQVLELLKSSNLPLLHEVAKNSYTSRPLVMGLLSLFYNLRFLDIFYLSYYFKIFLILLYSVGFFVFLKQSFKLNKFKENLILTIVFILSFWSLYVIEIDALSHLASLPIFLVLLSELKNFYENLEKRNYKFLFYFIIS